MMTAKEARVATEDSLIKHAKEFITNCVQDRIQDAIEEGHYFCIVSLVGYATLDVPNPKRVGPEVVRQLEQLGYKVTFDYCDNGPRTEACVNIDWTPED